MNERTPRLRDYVFCLTAGRLEVDDNEYIDISIFPGIDQAGFDEHRLFVVLLQPSLHRLPFAHRMQIEFGAALLHGAQIHSVDHAIHLAYAVVNIVILR